MEKIKEMFENLKDLIMNNKKMTMIVISIIAIIIIIWLLVAIGGKVNLSCPDVEEIALKKLGGGTITRCEREGKKYEVNIVHNNYEYEFEINGNTGEIIDYDGEYIGLGN